MKPPFKLLLIAPFLIGHFCALDAAIAQQFEAARNDQIAKLQTYILDAIQPSGLVRDSLVLSGNSFHPATPDAAGFALLGLSSLDHLGTLQNADQHVIDILSAHTGNTPGVTPERSADGHFIHFMDIADGTDPPGWDDSYSPISSALIVAGAQFAKNHFSENQTIADLADELTNSIDFDAAIHPSLDGRIFLDMTKSGGGSGGAVRPWNEFMLVHSLALKQPNNNRALAVAGDWLDVNQITKRTYDGTPTLSDSQNNFAPAFWVQQMHFFNGDFRHNADFETYFENARIADEAYSTDVLGETFRYGLTAGVSPQGYNADRILNHPNNVFSPEAVAAWGDMDTFLDFYNSQYPTTDSRYRYGLVRESATQPTWVPNDTALVDHLFLLFGLVESIHPNFYADRVFAPYIAGDFDDDGMVAGADFLEWQQEIPAAYDSIDLSNWLANYGSGAYASGAFVSVPEPQTVWLLAVLLGLTLKKRRRIEAAARR